MSFIVALGVLLLALLAGIVIDDIGARGRDKTPETTWPLFEAW